MTKFRLYVDKDEEAIWLNKMVAKGYALESYFLGFYHFKPCQAGEYIYQIDLLDNWSGDREEYTSFMEDTGVEVVAQWYRWVFLRKKAAEGAFEMYSDVDTKVKQYDRIRKFFLVGIILEAFCLMIELNASLSTGEPLYWGFVVFIGVIIVAFLRMFMKCNAKMNRLKQEIIQ